MVCGLPVVTILYVVRLSDLQSGKTREVLADGLIEHYHSAIIIRDVGPGPGIFTNLEIDPTDEQYLHLWSHLRQIREVDGVPVEIYERKVCKFWPDKRREDIGV